LRFKRAANCSSRFVPVPVVPEFSTEVVAPKLDVDLKLLFARPHCGRLKMLKASASRHEVRESATFCSQ
jgi:hypothetical protein